MNENEIVLFEETGENVTVETEEKEESNGRNDEEYGSGDVGTEDAEATAGDLGASSDASLDLTRTGQALPVCGDDEKNAKRKAHEELIEFFDLFPGVAFSDIPRSVRESELPLAAAYALYERRERRLCDRAEAENQRNRARTAGGLADGAETLYTRDEVRRMTREEVRADFDTVMRSIGKWK